MQATETFALGGTQVTNVVEIESEQIITGDFSGSVPAGTVGRLRGSIRLLADLHVRGTLTADLTGVDLDGQGLWDIHTHDGGVLNLQGVVKTGWVRWGEPVTGWQVGDRLVVSPTAINSFASTVVIWQGSWSATSRPGNSPPVLLPNGDTIEPEVGNLTRSLTIRNVTRMMMHESDGVPNVHTLKHLAVVNSGKLNTGFYPVHFHQLGESARGSLVEGVVVEGSKFRAFVPHASHGITFRDCVAYNITHDAYWWDQPPPNDSTINDSHDTTWEHCNSVGVTTPSTAPRQASFLLGRGNGNKCIDCAASANQNTTDAAGFSWPEMGDGVWEFRDCVAHNNRGDGIFVWQNTSLPHVVTDFIGYRNARSQIDHGAYTNSYEYRRMVLNGPETEGAFKLHARPVQGRPILIEDVVAGSRLLITKHQANYSEWTIVRRCSFPSIHYEETAGGGVNRSYIRHEDCLFHLTPSHFVLGVMNGGGIDGGSIIEIYEAGVLTYKWQSGGWL